MKKKSQQIIDAFRIKVLIITVICLVVIAISYLWIINWKMDFEFGLDYIIIMSGLSGIIILLMTCAWTTLHRLEKIIKESTEKNKRMRTERSISMRDRD